MAGLVPFNRRQNSLARTGTGFEDFYNMLDDFFSDGWLPSGRNLLRDTFKIDVRETDNEYLIEAELPGVKKEEIKLNIQDEGLCISVNREEDVNRDSNNYIHRERRTTSMSRSIRLADVQTEAIKAKLENGVLTIAIPKKEEKAGHSLEINIGSEQATV